MPTEDELTRQVALEQRAIEEARRWHEHAADIEAFHAEEDRLINGEPGPEPTGLMAALRPAPLRPGVLDALMADAHDWEPAVRDIEGRLPVPWRMVNVHDFEPLTIRAERPDFNTIGQPYVTYGVAAPARTQYIGGTLEDAHGPEAGKAPGVDIQGGHRPLSNHPVQQSAEVRKDYLLGMAAQDDVDFGGVFGRPYSPGAYAYLQRGG